MLARQCDLRKGHRNVHFVSLSCNDRVKGDAQGATTETFVVYVPFMSICKGKKNVLFLSFLLINFFAQSTPFSKKEKCMRVEV